MNGFDISTISGLYVGSTEYSAIYKGSTLLWQATLDYSKEYFTIESLTDNNQIKFMASSSDLTKTIEWSTNKVNWTSVTSSTVAEDAILTTLNTNEKIYIRGNNTQYCTGNNSYNYFVCSGNHKVSGNIMSLLYGSNFKNQYTLESNRTFYKLFDSDLRCVDASNLILPATTLTSYCYGYMFSGCTSLTAAPELPATKCFSTCYYSMFRNCISLTTAPELPATKLEVYCYYGMFSGCTSLTAAPELPATTLANYCYQNMFYNCESLTTAPELPATTLANYCYSRMFQSCDRLTAAPELPATTLANYCYQYMFMGCPITTAPELPATTLVTGCYDSMFYFCSSLKYVKAMFTNYSSDYTNNWLGYVSSTGTFVKNINATISTGASGIPSGWTIETVAA